MRFGWFFPFFKKIRFWGILGPPSYGIGATIRIGREMLCLPYAGFFVHNLVCMILCAWFNVHHLACASYFQNIVSLTPKQIRTSWVAEVQTFQPQQPGCIENKIWRKKDHWMNQSVNHESVCRTALAKPGLLIMAL